MFNTAALRPFPVINPSLLAADFANLQHDIRQLEEAGAKILHLDIMDGHFVPNLSFGIPVVEAIRHTTDLPLDVHLMLDNPEPYLPVFRKAGADLLSVHIEVAPDPRSLFEKIRKLGAVPGIVSNPPTPVEKILPFVEECDLILTMSVMPGFGGQTFNSAALEKIRCLREIAGANKILSIDGGIGESNIPQAAAAGADLLVTGTALFRMPDIKLQFQVLEHSARSSLQQS